MSDFSVGKFSPPTEIKFASGRTSEFTKALTVYKDFMAKTSQSDFANSPVVMQKELDMLVQLRDLAKKEKLSKESKWIETRLPELTEKLTSTKINLLANAYYAPVIVRGVQQETLGKPDEKLFALLNSCKNKDGFLDPNAELLLESLKGKDDNLYHTEIVLNKCREEDGSVNADKAQAVSQMANAGIEPARISEYVDKVTLYDANSDKDIVDFQMLADITSFMSEGLKDVDAVNFAEILKGNFENKDSIKGSLIKLYKADINSSVIPKIINSLAVPNKDTGKLEVSSDSVANIASLKKEMSKTRDNETNERNNPINLLDVSVFTVDDITMVAKNGKFTYVTPLEGKEDVEVTKEKYNTLVASIEDNMLLEFAGKYKDGNGEIDSKYVRVASRLRNAGMVYNGLFNLVDSCIKEDGEIDTQRVNAIETVRASGALSDDVPLLLEACEKDENGNYSETDIKHVCDLTSCVVGGKEVCSLLPVVRESDEIKDIMMVCAPNFSDNEKLFEILDMLKRPDGNFGENEMEVFYDLALNYFSREENVGDEDNFMKVANEIKQIAKAEDGTISDDAAGICAIMCQKGENIYSIRNAMTACYDENFKVDGKLSQILWDMYLQEANLDEVLDVLKVCKTEDGKVDHDKADMVTMLFEAKFPKDKILQLVQH